MASVRELIDDIHRNRQSSANAYDTKSQKDELAIMRAMLNDKSYQVNVYGNEGIQYQYCPALAIRDTCSSIITNSTGISMQESTKIMENYEFKPHEAKNLIDLSKEFVNTYLETGRKLPLGGRERSNVSLIKKIIPAGKIAYPVKVGEDENGKAICESKETHVEEYDSIRVYGPCPNWIKNKGGKKK